MSGYWGAIAVMTVAIAAWATAFHFHRPSRRRSPETATAIFSAVLAAGIWVQGIVEQTQENERRDSEVAAMGIAVSTAVSAADRRAGQRDKNLLQLVLAKNANASSLPSTNRVDRSDNSVLVRRIAILETEKEMNEQFARERASEVARITDDARRALCRMKSYEDTQSCTKYSQAK